MTELKSVIDRDLPTHHLRDGLGIICRGLRHDLHALHPHLLVFVVKPVVKMLRYLGRQVYVVDQEVLGVADTLHTYTGGHIVEPAERERERERESVCESERERVCVLAFPGNRARVTCSLLQVLSHVERTCGPRDESPPTSPLYLYSRHRRERERERERDLTQQKLAHLS